MILDNLEHKIYDVSQKKSNKESLISITTSVSNGKKYIEETILSIINQNIKILSILLLMVALQMELKML
jgi:hypothetical protein